MDKNSFSLLETIIAITVISILVGGFLKSSNYSSSNYLNLDQINNHFSSNDSQSLTRSTFGLSYDIDNQTTVYILNSGDNTKLQYHKNDIFFEKYILEKNKKILNFKEFN